MSTSEKTANEQNGELCSAGSMKKLISEEEEEEEGRTQSMTTGWTQNGCVVFV